MGLANKEPLKILNGMYIIDPGWSGESLGLIYNQFGIIYRFCRIFFAISYSKLVLELFKVRGLKFRVLKLTFMAYNYYQDFSSPPIKIQNFYQVFYKYLSVNLASTYSTPLKFS